MPFPFLLIPLVAGSGMSTGTCGALVAGIFAGGAGIGATAWAFFNDFNSSSSSKKQSDNKGEAEVQASIFVVQNYVTSLDASINSVAEKIQQAFVDRHCSVDTLDKVNQELAQTKNDLNKALKETQHATEQLQALQQEMKELHDHLQKSTIKATKELNQLNQFLSDKNNLLHQAEQEISRLHVSLEKQAQSIGDLAKMVSQLDDLSKEQLQTIILQKNKIAILEPNIAILSQQNRFFSQVITNNKHILTSATSQNSTTTDLPFKLS